MAPSSGGGMKQKSMAIMHDCGSNLAWEDLEKKLIYQDFGTSHHHHHHNDPHHHDDPSTYPIIRGVMTELCDDGLTAIRRPNGQEYDEPIIVERPAQRKFDSPIMSKTKPGKKDIDSYTIKGTSKIVKVDDCVLMRASDVDKPPYVARIEKIESDGKNNVKVKVRWYYRPEESIGGRRQFHGAKELFLSDHFDWQSANTIEGICIVHSFKNYTKLDNVGQEDFFCRFEYKAATGAFTPDRVAVYCKCEMPYNPDDLMVQCDACKDWFHPSCMEMSIEDAKKLDHFLCSDCQPENEPKRTPNGFSSSPNSEPKVESKRRKRQGRG